jgi:hypothetical protein
VNASRRVILGSGSPPGVGNKLGLSTFQPFEDEDDDEYENDKPG